MDTKVLRIGTRESQLAVWQATRVQELLNEFGYQSQLVYIKSDGDIDLQTPLYEMGVQGIFTRSLDIALLNNQIDIAVHSMKDVPTQLPNGIVQCAVLKRGSYKDLLVYKGDESELKTVLGLVDGQWMENDHSSSLLSTANRQLLFATSSIRRKAQWLNRYPHHAIENLRGNVNTRLKKVEESNWDGAIFAAAGLERINLRPQKSIELDWMLPAPAQGAIVIVCRADDTAAFEACENLNDAHSALCTKIEKDFLRTLLGGCSTPISALAVIEGDKVILKGNIFALDGNDRAEVEMVVNIGEVENLGVMAAHQLLANGGQSIADSIQHGK